MKNFILLPCFAYVDFYKQKIHYKSEEYIVQKPGKVFSLKFGKMKELKQSNDSNGYLFVNLCINKKIIEIYVHRLVWMSFNGEIQDGFDVHHKNHDKADNRIENLELIEHSEHASNHKKGNKYNLGKHWNLSEETKAKMKEA